jgi:chemotaxis protein CheC
MSALSATFREPLVDRVRELTSVGAGHAATALAQLVGRTIWMRVPQVRVLLPEHTGSPYISDVANEQPRGMVGVFFELEGGLGGVLAFLFSAETCQRLVGAVTGRDPDLVDAELAKSAMREIGNILASHVASAHAGLLGVTVLPSVPVLAMHDGPAALASLLASRHAPEPSLRVETELSDRARELHGLLVFVPDTLDRVAPAAGF